MDGFVLIVIGEGGKGGKKLCLHFFSIEKIPKFAQNKIIMTTIELKGQLLNVIARLEDEHLLKEILNFTIGVAKKTDMLEDMPAEAIVELELALEDSLVDATGTPHDEVMKMAYSWLKN